LLAGKKQEGLGVEGRAGGGGGGASFSRVFSQCTSRLALGVVAGRLALANSDLTAL